MSSVLSSIGGLFSKGAAPVSLGLGEIGNLLAGHAQSSALSKAEAPLPGYQAQLQQLLATTPAQEAQQASAIQQPLNQNLVQTTQNTVNADLASRGLSESPGISAATESQALAPFEQQNYDTALSTVAQKLGLDESTVAEQIQSIMGTIPGLLPKGQSLSPAMLMLLMQNKGKASPTASAPASAPANPALSDAPQPDMSGLTPPDLSALGVAA